MKCVLLTTSMQNIEIQIGGAELTPFLMRVIGDARMILKTSGAGSIEFVGGKNHLYSNELHLELQVARR